MTARLANRSLPLALLPLLLLLPLLPAGCGGGGGGGGSSPPSLPGRTYGGAGDDVAWSVVQAPDGGFVFAGFTDSSGAGGFDAWVVRTDPSGNVVRQRTFGASDDDLAFSVIALPGGGYVVAGVDNVATPGTPVNVKRYPLDTGGTLTLRRLDANLDDVWTTTLTDVEVDGRSYPYTLGYAVRRDTDGGFLVAGATANDGGGGEALLVKADSGGTILWKSYPSALSSEIATCAVPASSGGYAVSCAGGGRIVRTGSTGLPTWSRILGHDLHAVLESSWGFVAAGDNTGNSYDAYLGKVDGGGSPPLWQHAYGSPGGDGAFSMEETGTGPWGHVLAGMGSGGGANHLFDAYLVRTDGDGVLLWQRYFGGLGDDVARSVCVASDGGFAVAGCTASAGAGGYDGWIVRTDPGGASLW